MSIGGISNSSQPALTGLSNTARLLEKTQKNLSSGKAVNSPADNATAYYVAQSLLQQASGLSDVKDTLSTSLTTLSATTGAISSVTQVVKQLQGITAQASATTDPTIRANLAQQYNDLLPQLDQLVSDATFNGTNLLKGSSTNLTVNLNTTNTSQLVISGVDVTSSGLNISAAANNFASDGDISAANAQLLTAQATLNTAAASFGTNATLIETNQDFTSGLINSLANASDNLTKTDVNEDAANLLALQAQSQLGVVSLGISTQVKESILKLF